VHEVDLSNLLQAGGVFAAIRDDEEVCPRGRCGP
jgi:hypothetical protein